MPDAQVGARPGWMAKMEASGGNKITQRFPSLPSYTHRQDGHGGSMEAIHDNHLTIGDRRAAASGQAKPTGAGWTWTYPWQG